MGHSKPFSPPRLHNGKPDLQRIARMYSLKVENLSSRVDEVDLCDMFSRYGKVGDVFIPLSDGTRARGFGFVRFFNQRDSERARDRLDGEHFKGKRITVSIARARRQYSPVRREYSPPSRRYRSRSRSPVRKSDNDDWRRERRVERRRSPDYRRRSRDRSYTPERSTKKTRYSSESSRSAERSPKRWDSDSEVSRAAKSRSRSDSRSLSRSKSNTKENHSPASDRDSPVKNGHHTSKDRDSPKHSRERASADRDKYSQEDTHTKAVEKDDETKRDASLERKYSDAENSPAGKKPVAESEDMS